MIKTKPFEIPKRLVYQAYKEIKSNRGSAGIDEVSIEDFEKDLKNNLYPPILMVDTFSQNRLIQFLHSTFITMVSSLLQTVPPLYSALVFYPHNFRYLWRFPFHQNYRFSSSILKPELCSRHLYSGYRPASKQVPSRLIPR